MPDNFPILVSSGCSAEGANTSMPPKTGQTVSFADFDDGYYEDGSGDSFLTLEKLNPFNNYERFTGITGGYTNIDASVFYDKLGNVTTEGLAFPNDLLLDWDTYNKLGNGNVLMILRKQLAGTSVNWENCRLWAAGRTDGGYTDWRMPNIRFLTNLIYYFNPQTPFYAYSYGALGIKTAIQPWSSSNTSTNAYHTLNTNQTTAVIAKTTTLFKTAFAVRISNISELTI